MCCWQRKNKILEAFQDISLVSLMKYIESHFPSWRQTLLHKSACGFVVTAPGEHVWSQISTYNLSTKQIIVIYILSTKSRKFAGQFLKKIWSCFYKHFRSNQDINRNGKYTISIRSTPVSRTKMLRTNMNIRKQWANFNGSKSPSFVEIFYNIIRNTNSRGKTSFFFFHFLKIIRNEK